METGSETDEDDRTLVSEDGGPANGSAAGGGGGGGGDDEEQGSPAGVPPLEASPRVAHALLSSEGSEVRDGLQNLHQRWRLGDDSNGHLSGSGESSHDRKSFFFKNEEKKTSIKDIFIIVPRKVTKIQIILFKL